MDWAFIDCLLFGKFASDKARGAEPCESGYAAWIQTRNGRAFDLLLPNADDVDFREIAAALSYINRFAGHAGGYSVAQHSWHGAFYLAKLCEMDAARAFLLHDAHEAYIGDITSPAAIALQRLAPGAQVALGAIKHGIDRVVHLAAGVPRRSPEIAARVREIDLRMLRTERDQLLRRSPRPWHDSIETAEPLPIHIDRVSVPGIAARRWLNLFETLIRPL